MIRPSVLLLATLMASPSLYLAFVTRQLPIETAMARFLLAVGAAAVMVTGLRYITANYGERRELQMPLRRSSDQTVEGGRPPAR
jgi:hypothetical protein